MIGACGMLVFPLLQPYLKHSYPVLNNLGIAAVEPVGGKRFVLLKYDVNYSDDGLNLVNRIGKLTMNEIHNNPCTFFRFSHGNEMARIGDGR